jgi:CRP-like cAMP-binding protein
MDYKGLWSELPQDIRWQFESQSSTLQFKRGEHIYRQGDHPRGVYFVKAGLVGLTKIGTTGKEHLLRFFKDGQFFGHRAMFSNEDYHGSTVALEPTKLKLVPKDTVLSALKAHPNLLMDLVTVLARELRHCESQHVMILDNQIHVRVAQGLVYLKDLHPDHNWTRQEIANFCASTVSTVIKALSDLEALGFISQEGRAIKILRREKLVSMQDEV